MSLFKESMITKGFFVWALILSLSLIIGGCGVKGPPLPPEEPPTLGRGSPNFPGAAKSVGLRNRVVISPSSLESEDEKEGPAKDGTAKDGSTEDSSERSSDKN